MLAGTHFFTPVVIAGSVDLFRVLSGRSRLFSGKALFCIGICGILPDLADPHIRLAARMSSWSHTVWFGAAVLPLLMLRFLFRRDRQTVVTIVLCWLAVWLHLLFDAVSGGIVPLYPLNPGKIGAYFVPPSQWIAADILTTAAAVVMMAAVIKYDWAAKKRCRKRGILDEFAKE